MLNVFRRSWWPESTSLVRVEGVPGHHDVRSYPDAGGDSLRPNLDGTDRCGRVWFRWASGLCLLPRHS